MAGMIKYFLETAGHDKFQPSHLTKLFRFHILSDLSTGCPFLRGSGDLIRRKCSNLTGNLDQKVGKHIYSNRNQTFWIKESYRPCKHWE